MKIFKSLSSETFYKLISTLANGILNISEEFLKQWLGTVMGGRFLKWFTDILVKRFADQLVRPIIMLGVIRLGYYYDVHDAKNKIKKLENAEDANDEELYIRTLNDILRK
jgi:hypothetical protein